jgi:glycine cleavage system H protein
MENPRDYRYTDDHEWAKIDGDIAVMGITNHAATQLTDITYVEILQPVGATISQGEVVGSIDSVKSAAEFNSPLSGEIIEINPTPTDKPEILNEDPYGEGWLIKVRPSDLSELDALKTAEAYDEFEKSQS